MAVCNQPRTVWQPPKAEPVSRAIKDDAYLRAYVLPNIADGVRRPAARRCDALRLEVSGAETHSLRAIGTLPGVVVLAAAGRNGRGTGMLRTSGSGTWLSWRAPGSNRFGAAVVCDSDGSYLLEDGRDLSKWLRVEVHVDYLVPGAVDARVYLADAYNNGHAHDDVSAAEADAGDIEDYTITLANDSLGDLIDVKAWLELDTAQKIEISSDDINYYAPTFEDHVNALSWARITAGGSETLYLRRTIAASAGYDPGVLNQLKFAWTGL